ncbi:MAG: hypothetical protein DWQ06_16650 [Calditrichaeota bacterium]|nr:MAG: hypothetical protein DWQ06_16650 [Calditrichota bacterium]
MNCDQANELPIQEIVKTILNFEEGKKRGSDIWFKSPFRKEETASFKINLETNRWYDFGKSDGVSGGRIIDLFLELKQGTISQILETLESSYQPQDKQKDSLFSFPEQKQFSSENSKKEISSPKKQFKIIRVKPLKNEALIDYVESREIKIEIARKYLQEIYFRNLKNQKTYFAVAFKNNSDSSFEWKNKFLGGCFGHKDLTVFLKNEKRTEINVFEGFFDFLAHLSYFEEKEQGSDILVLNSVALTKRAMLFLEKHNYTEVNLFLDNDKAGEEATQKFKTLKNIQVKDQREIYKNYKDFNEFFIQTRQD